MKSTPVVLVASSNSYFIYATTTLYKLHVPWMPVYLNTVDMWLQITGISPQLSLDSQHEMENTKA